MVHLHRILVVFLVLSLSGCSTVELREAQDSYADAVRIESDIRAAGGEESLMNLSAAQLAYRDALGKLDEVIGKKSDDLRSNNLLGSAKVMRALMLWRITGLDFDEVSDICKQQGGDTGDEPKDGLRRQWVKELRSIESGLQGNNLTLESRDRTVYRALYGLYAFDILKSIDYASSDVDIPCSLDWFNQSMKHFRDAAKIPAPTHEIHKWLALSSLTVQSDYNARLEDAGKDAEAQNAGFRLDPMGAVCPAKYFWKDPDKGAAYLEQINNMTVDVIKASDHVECP